MALYDPFKNITKFHQPIYNNLFYSVFYLNCAKCCNSGQTLDRSCQRNCKKRNAIYLQRRASLSANMCRHTADTHCSLMKRVLSGFWKTVLSNGLCFLDFGMRLEASWYTHYITLFWMHLFKTNDIEAEKSYSTNCKPILILKGF